MSRGVCVCGVPSCGSGVTWQNPRCEDFKGWIIHVQREGRGLWHPADNAVIAGSVVEQR